MKVINKKSSIVIEGHPKMPTSEQLEYGEIAVNYADGHETLAIKNSANDIVQFGSKNYVASAISEALSAVSTDALTSVTVNGLSATSADSIITIDTDDINVASDITYSGVTVISSASNVTQAFSGLVNKMVDNELVTSQALLDLHDEIGNVEFTIIPYSGTLESNVREAYILIDGNGTQKGSIIKVYKDSSIERIYLGHIDDALANPSASTVVSGTGSTALCIIYLKTDGTYELVAIDLTEFIEENEFGNGLQVSAHVVSVKIDPNSEPYLRVTSSGLSISGISEAISAASMGLTSVTINGYSATVEDNEVTLDADDLLIGSDIEYSGVTIISSEDTIADAIDTLVEKIGEDETVTSQALLELHEDVGQLAQLISAETARATSSETILNNAITAETSRATGVEGTLSGSINTEIERATSAETALSNRIDAISGSSDYKVTAYTGTVESNVREAYMLVDGNNVQKGSVIKIYNDSSLDSVYIGHVDDALVNASATTVTAGTGDTALCFIYHLEDGTYSLVALNVETFLQESEFGDGLNVSAHVVSVKVDAASEPYLTVSADGVKLSGITGAISAETIRATGAEDALSGRIDSEITRATGAEDALSGRIDSEITRATGAEDALSGRIDSEITRATGVEQTLSGMVSAETARATSAETEIRGLIGASLSSVTVNGKSATTADTVITLDGGDLIVGGDVTYSGLTVISSASTVSGAFVTLADKIWEDELVTSQALLDLHDSLNGIDAGISAETQRAIAAENALSGRIDSEITRATGAEDALSGRIDSEITRATGAEDALSGRIDSEITRATGAEDALSGRIDSEITRATGVEQALSGMVSAETARATSAETALSGAIDDMRSLVDVALSSVIINGKEATVENTIITLDSGDLLIGNDIDYSGLTIISSASTVSGAFETILDKIGEDERVTANALLELKEGMSGMSDLVSVETQRATAAENALSGRIDSEITRATGAENVLSGRIDSEITRATGAENVLSGRIDSEITRATDAENALSGRIDSEITRATGAEDALSGRIDSEITRATGAENVLSGRIDSEITRATDAENALSGMVSAETARATSAETALSGAIDDVRSLIGASLSSVTVNGKSATTADTVITLDGGDLIVGGDVTYSGETVIASTSSVSGAFGTLLQRLGAETVRATEAESAISGMVTAETSRAETAEGTIMSAVTAETQRATGVEETLSGNINSVKAKVDGLEIVAYTGSVASNVREAYILADSAGTQMGSVIKIYNDSSLYNVYIGHVDDALVDSSASTVTTGTGDTALCFIYHLEDGTYSLAKVNVETFLSESEFKSGLTVDNHVVSVNAGNGLVITNANAVAVKLNQNTEPYLTVDSNGLLLSGVTGAISAETIRAAGVEAELSGVLTTIGSALETNLTGVTVNGKSATVTSQNAGVVISGTDITVGSAITYSGRTLIESTSSVTEAIQRVVNEISDNEEVIATAWLDLDERINELSGRTGGGGLDTVVVNGKSATTSGNVITLDSSDILVGNNIDYSGLTIISGTSNISGGLNTLVEKIRDNERVATVALFDLRSDIMSVASTVGSETSRAQGVEQTISGMVAAETARAISAETELSGALATIGNAITGVTVNGKAATVTSQNADLTLSGTEMTVGSAITVDGDVLIAPTSSITEGLNKIVSEIIDNEEVFTTALLELNTRLNGTQSGVTGLDGRLTTAEQKIEELSGSTGSGTLTEVVVNGQSAVVSGGVATVNVSGTQMTLGSNIVFSGETLIASTSSVTEGMDKLVQEMIRNERVTSAAINDLNNRMYSAVTSGDVQTMIENNETLAVTSTNITTISAMTQNAYDALVASGATSSSVLYIITGTT